MLRSPPAQSAPSALRALFPSAQTPWLVFSAGCALSFLAFGLIRAGERAALRLEFERRAHNVALRVEDYLVRTTEPLYALRNLFDYAGPVSRAEFTGAARDLISRSFSVQALEWVPRVPAADRARIEAETRADGFPGFQFTERSAPTVLRRAADRPEHFPVLFIEPYADNELAHGYDLASGRTWPNLLEIVDTGRLGASGRLPLLDRANTGNTWAYIMQLPVYDRPLAGATPAQRQAVLRGYIVGVFRLRDLLETMFQRMGGLGVDVLFLDQSTPSDPQFLHYHSESPLNAAAPPTALQIAAGPHLTIPLHHAGRQWELWARPDPAWLARQPTGRGWFALAFGLTLSGGLGLFLRSQRRRAGLVEELVARRTAELDAARAALASSEERYRAFIEQSAEPIWRVENRPPIPLDLPVEQQIEHIFAHAYIAECNDAMAQAYGYLRAAQLAGTPVAELLDPAEPRNRAFLRAFLAAPGHRLIDVESHETARDGRKKIFLNSLTGIVADNTLVRAWGTQRDITARREAELALAENRRLLDSMMDQLPGMSVRCTAGPGYPAIYISRGVERLTGYVADDFFSERIRYENLIHPDDRPLVWPEILSATAARRPFQTQYRLRDRHGAEHWVLELGHGLYHADGHLEFIDSLSIDITAQKTAEAGRLALERKLLDSQKLESLGLLAGGIAHDFNNLLTVVLGSASLARAELPREAAAESHLRQIETAGKRAAELCAQMLAYAGKGRFVVEPTDLNQLAEGLRSLLKISVGQHARLAFNLAPALPAVMADATQLRQIVMNLVINAAEAIGDRGGDISLATGLRAFDAAALAGSVTGAHCPPGDYVWLEVRDTGPGMTPEVLAKIFDPFFSTKFTGRGLGLAAVLGIVRGHNGALQVATTPGVGTTFRLLLPPVPGTPAGPAPEPSSPPWQTAARVLVIDDDATVRAVATAILGSVGFTAESAADGQAGLDLYRAAPARYDLVILDLLMPGLSGEQTLVELRRVRAEVRVLLMSGFNEGDLLARHAGGGPLAYLPKPFTRDGLRRAVRALVG